MSTVNWHTARSSGQALRRSAVVSLATACLIMSALALSTPAGAAQRFGPHAAGSHASRGESPLATVHANSTVAPLSLAIFTVTDLATGNATTYKWSNVAPSYPQNENCNHTVTDQLCMTYGSSSGSDGGQFTTTSPGGGAGFEAGTTYPDVGSQTTLSAGGSTCGEFAPNGPATAAIELDQYVFTSGSTPVQAVALQVDCTNASVDISGTIAYNIVPTDPTSGYYVFGQAGELSGFGNDNYLLYLDGAFNYNLNAPIVGMAATPGGGGYWMTGSDGGVYASGDAGFYGSTGSLTLNKPVVGMAATPDGKGYWFVASDGGIFAYGDAGFYGSTGSLHLNKPIVGMVATPSGHGYWLVASDGGIFSYGDAGFYGSTGSLHLNKPVVGMAGTPDGHGYWFVASDGGIFSYGDAGFYGSTGSIALSMPIVGMAGAPDGHGYWFAASDGGVFNYGSAAFDGSLGGTGVTDAAGIALGT